MTAAVLFRGHAHRDGPPHGIDWRRSVASHWRFLLAPLRRRRSAVDVYLCLYDTPLRADVEMSYGPVRTRIATPGATQRQTFLAGLDEVIAGAAGVHQYDLVVTCRFDVELLQDPTEHPGFRDGKINFLWREWHQQAWDDHRRVPDAIHLLPGELLDGFRRGVAETPSENCLHLVWRPVARHVGEDALHVMRPEGFTDSNTDVMPNEFYRMVRLR